MSNPVQAQELNGGPIDTRIVLYRLSIRIFFLALVFTAIKLWIIDTVVVQTDQMEPTLLTGDRVLLNKLALLPLVRSIFPPARGDVVVSRTSRADRVCLRIAAVSGDSIAVHHGVFHNYTASREIRDACVTPHSLLPADYSLRDNLAPWRLPSRGDELRLDSLELRPFFFVSECIRQQTPRKEYEVRVTVYIDGEPIPTPDLSNFALYSGALFELPDSLRRDPFFWERCEEYLQQRNPDKSVALLCALYTGSTRIKRFRLNESCIFLIADNWCEGYDSRFFGPVSLSSLSGRVAVVLWSFAGSATGKHTLRTRRIGKIVH